MEVKKLAEKLHFWVRMNAEQAVPHEKWTKEVGGR
jgi:hypothetical protein